ncbi:tetratricopeptide repeat protein [Tumidithrix elongata RA019]|uniref:Tetratricopeptide repeat protein n=1 Tax=Tumidithrix elongata BACA0141 TaxID=2716417 RepID=A0AAW9PVC1_9CYAN|nr:tetratricopeptide repeat protein [Tumidithrix elongata RA019]
MNSWILYGLAVYALLIGSNYLIVYQRLLKIVLQYSSYEQIQAEEVPPTFIEVFQIQIAELEAMGFEFLTYLKLSPSIPLSPNPTYGVLLCHPEYHTYAEVYFRHLADPANLFDVELYNRFDDGTTLLTMNGKAYGLIGDIPDTTVWDPYAVSMEYQWQSHCDKVREIGKPSRTLAIAEYVEDLGIRGKRYIDRLLERQQISLVPDKKKTQASSQPRFQLNWKFAWHHAIKLRNGNGKAAAMLKKRAELAKENPSLRVKVPIELEIEGFDRMQQVEQGSIKRGFGIWIFVGSLVLSLISFLPWFPNASRLLVLVAVLFFHEAGHWLAMRLCGYTNTSVFFIPLFGAAATGRKHDASVTEQFIVLLAGPLPGLLIGLGLAFGLSQGAIYPQWLTEAMWMAIGLNFANLLPIYPLDGGRIVDLLMFSRYPFTDVIFKVLAVALFLFIAVMDRTGGSLIGAIGVVVALSIPNSWRSARLVASIRKQEQSQKESDLSTQSKTRNKAQNPTQQELLAQIYDAMRSLKFSDLPFYKRYNLAKGSLQRVQNVRSRRFTRFGLGIVYLICLLGMPIAAIAKFGNALIPYAELGEFKKAKQQANRYQKKIYEQKLSLANQILATNPKDRKAYIDRGNAKLFIQDYKSAIADYTKAIELNPQDGDGYVLRGSAWISLKDDRNALKDFDEAIRLNPKNLLAYEGRIQLFYGQQKFPEALKAIDDLLRIDPNNIDAYDMRGSLRQMLGDSAGAQQDTKTAVLLSKQQGTDEPTQKSFLLSKIETANALIKGDPTDRKAYLDRGEAYRQLKQFQPALDDFSQAIALYPKDPTVYLQRGRTYITTKDNDKAIKDAERILAIDPQNIEAYGLRSQAKKNSGDEEGFKADIQKVIEIRKQLYQ